MNEINIGKMPSSHKKLKKTILLGFVLLLVIGGITSALLYIRREKQFVSECATVGGKSAQDINGLLVESKTEELKPITDEIQGNPMAGGDVDCQYILLGYNVTLSDSVEAEKYLNKIKEINNDYDPSGLFGEQATSLDTYKKDVEFFKEQLKELEKSTSPIFGTTPEEGVE